MTDTPEQKKTSPQSQSLFLLPQPHMVMNEAFLFVQIDTRWLREDKSNREDRQKLVHFCLTVYILYAFFFFQKYREKKAFFVCHFLFVFVLIPSFFCKPFLIFFEMHVDSSPKFD
jgi:dolichol kinase